MDARSKELRLKLLTILERSRRGHVGSALSILEIVRVLYDDILRFDSANPHWEDRDRFVLSKGHGCLALYLLLAEKGFFPEAELYTASEFNSRLGGHPMFGLPGVEAATGSLGHGLSIAVGMAVAARIDRKSHRIIALVGDGECQEGAIWEAALSAHKHKLSNLTILVDRNRLQCYGTTAEVQDIEPFAAKWRAFGLAVRECDGHNPAELRQHLSSTPFEPQTTSVLICNTHKGMGMATTQDNPEWHHKTNVTDEEITTLRRELA
jgi:transketolase